MPQTEQPEPIQPQPQEPLPLPKGTKQQKADIPRPKQQTPNLQKTDDILNRIRNKVQQQLGYQFENSIDSDRTLLHTINYVLTNPPPDTVFDRQRIVEFRDEVRTNLRSTIKDLLTIITPTKNNIDIERNSNHLDMLADGYSTALETGDPTSLLDYMDLTMRRRKSNDPIENEGLMGEVLKFRNARGKLEQAIKDNQDKLKQQQANEIWQYRPSTLVPENQ